MKAEGLYRKKGMNERIGVERKRERKKRIQKDRSKTKRNKK